MVQAKQTPLKVTVGAVTVRIYPREKPSGTYYQLADYSTGARIFRSFPDAASAKKEAKRIAELISGGDALAAQMTGADRQTFFAILQKLRPLGLDPLAVASEAVEAHKILGGRSVITAARYYASTHPATMAQKTVAEVAAEFLDAKTKAKKSADYLSDCRYRHGKFAAAFQMNIADVTGPLIVDFLDGLKLSDRSRDNFRLSIGTLFEFAKARRYVPTDWNGLTYVERIGNDEGEITTFAPEELALFLERSRPELIPFLAIGAFAGLRSSEIERLEWKDVNTIPGKILVTADNARKTRKRRLVPILPNLAKWLAPFQGSKGKVLPFADVGLQIRELCEKQGDLPALTWKRNALRHSFISYRLAIVESAAQVALEAGNSETMIFKNYRELVTPDAAKEWFSIAPTAS